MSLQKHFQNTDILVSNFLRTINNKKFKKCKNLIPLDLINLISIYSVFVVLFVVEESNQNKNGITIENCKNYQMITFKQSIYGSSICNLHCKTHIRDSDKCAVLLNIICDVFCMGLN